MAVKVRMGEKEILQSMKQAVVMLMMAQEDDEDSDEDEDDLDDDDEIGDGEPADDLFAQMQSCFSTDCACCCLHLVQHSQLARSQAEKVQHMHAFATLGLSSTHSMSSELSDDPGACVQPTVLSAVSLH